MTLVEISAVFVSTSLLAVPTTVTFSLYTRSAVILKFTVTFWPTSTWTVFAWGLYCGRATVISYVPGVRPFNAKKPTPSAKASYVKPLPVSLATMDAPGNGPVSSVIVPWMPAVVPCAATGIEPPAMSTSPARQPAHQRDTRRFIGTPPFA